MSSLPTLKYCLLSYQQLTYLGSILEEAKNFNRELVSFELHDDGSPKEVQEEVARIVARYPNIQAVLHPANRGMFAMLETCLENSHNSYTYIGAGDDAPCVAAFQHALLKQQREKNLPLIVSDFYVIHSESRTSIYVEAILPREWRTGQWISPEKLKDILKYKRESMYIATHGALAPTNAVIAAGGYPPKMRWHCDWFSFHIAALRTGIQYVSIPLACWRQSPAGLSASATSKPQQREVLREIFSTLGKPEYADVQEMILCPNMMPILPDIAFQTLLAILPKPKYWRLLRWGHFQSALHEIAAPWIAPERWGGKILQWIDKSRFARLVRFLYQPFLRLLLKLGGAQIGRNVHFGRKAKIREPRGLNIGDDVIIGSNVSICAMHPLNIGSGTRIGNNVRLESANFSEENGVKFFRKKTVTIEGEVSIGDGCTIGPGAYIREGKQIPPHTRIENVEKTPLFLLDETNQIRVDHQVLEEWYGVDPQGIPLKRKCEKEADELVEALN